MGEPDDGKVVLPPVEQGVGLHPVPLEVLPGHEQAGVLRNKLVVILLLLEH